MWNLFTAAAWEAALNCSEMAALGWHPWYWRLHWCAARLFFRDSPYQVMMRETAALAMPEGQCVYGETPAFCMLSMLRRLGVGSQDVLYDLGCGRGLALMAASLQLGIRAVGIDVVPTMVERARDMASRLGIDQRVEFIQGDFLDQDLSAGTVFYLASTTFEPITMQAISRKLAALAQSPLQVITLSQPLGEPFVVTSRARYPMTWGWCTVFFQRRH